MKKQNSNLERETIRFLWDILLENKRLFFLSLTYLIGVVGLTVLIPLFISMTLANIVTQKADIWTSLLPLIVSAIVGVLSNLIGFIALVRLSTRVQKRALEIATTALLARSVGFHTNNIGGKLVSNTLDYPNALGKLIDTVYLQITPFILTMIIGISVVLNKSLPMGSALFGITLLTTILVLLESRRRSERRAERKRALNHMVANLSDTIVNTQAIKTFANEQRELAKHDYFSSVLMNLRLKDWTSTGAISGATLAVLITLQISFIAFIAHLIKTDPAVLGVGIFAFAYTLTLTSKLFEVGAMIRNIEESLLQAASMTEILLEETEIKDAPRAKPLRIKKGEIALNSIDFAYSDAKDEHVFRSLSLKISAGQKVGIVGPSGGGKSTFTRLLLRFDDVTKGSITIDGSDIKKVTQESLRKAISYVPQEPLLFHRTIEENIAYGKPDAPFAEIKAATKLAYADSFIEKLPQKYKTIVGERGVKLSGGQRQRIAIARAILKDAPILILDEATSALDSESEVYIQRALARLMKKRTAIVIAHRLSTIQKMDRIIVLDDGRIVEDGTHQKLIKQNGLYAKLWAHQSGGFIEE